MVDGLGLAFKFSSWWCHLGLCHFSLSLQFLNHPERLKNENLPNHTWFYRENAEIYNIQAPNPQQVQKYYSFFPRLFWLWHFCPFTNRKNTEKHVTEMVKGKCQLRWACMRRKGRPRLCHRIKNKSRWKVGLYPGTDRVERESYQHCSKHLPSLQPWKEKKERDWSATYKGEGWFFF